MEDLTIKMEGWKEKATEREKQLKFANDSLEEEKTKSSRLELELKESDKPIQVKQTNSQPVPIDPHALPTAETVRLPCFAPTSPPHSAQRAVARRDCIAPRFCTRCVGRV